MPEKSFMSAIAKVNVQLKDGSDLSRRYLSESPYGGLIIDTDGLVSEEDLVELDVGFRQSQEHYLIKAVVLWRRHTEQGLSVGVGFLPSEIEKRERLLAARREKLFQHNDNKAARASDRYEAVLKVTYKSSEDFVFHFTRNLSFGGMFVASDSPPDVDREILFQLYPPGEDDAIELPGRVMWSQPGYGFGVNFTSAKDEARVRLENLVRHVSIGANSNISEPVFEPVNRR